MRFTLSNEQDGRKTVSVVAMLLLTKSGIPVVLTVPLHPSLALDCFVPSSAKPPLLQINFASFCSLNVGRERQLLDVNYAAISARQREIILPTYQFSGIRRLDARDSTRRGPLASTDSPTQS